ncbi:16S rRNA (guanine(527)-N(7))-methyltransferase RsmG [Vreelandella utahensis]|uniref:16S rRNA (guanine(527)-N(7))-methyltransferase RsmG n=1 Tax=Vreelandella halophila TaxID=86177 RepID=UPI0009873B8D|nr:16S rRNA (guanine(527)-N(7))-methyltransferase RsmG [Halomonas utahensis]
MDAERRELEAGAEALGVSLAPETVDRMLRLLDLLEKWNRAYNLTAVRERSAMCARHLLDSLTLVPRLGSGPVLDVGSGGGFPGLVLALHSPARQVTLLDSNSKKTRFLTQCRLELGLDNMQVVQARVEDWQGGPFPQITSRAFASLAEMVPMTAHLLAADGEHLAMKGPEATTEVEGLPSGWQLLEDSRVTVPGVDAERRILRIGRNSSDSTGETGD